MSPVAAPPHRSAAKVVALTLLFVGLLFGGVGWMFAHTSRSLLAVSVPAEGKVIRMVRNGRNPNGGAAPVVEFHVEGVRHEFQSWLYVSPPQYKVGDQVTVLFDPRDARHATIASFTDLWLFPTIFGGIGGALVIAGGITLTVACWPRLPTLTSNSTNYLD